VERVQPLAMKATVFEYRHQTLLHLLLVALAVLTYLIDPDDVVWAMVRHHANSALLERLVFGTGTILVVGSAVLETSIAASLRMPTASRASLLISRLLLVLALGLLLPLPGVIILLAGEVLLCLRLALRKSETEAPQQTPEPGPAQLPGNGAAPDWRRGFQASAFKWGFAAQHASLHLDSAGQTG
jgi:hypothetical protein